jgi:hypothetical protein
VSLGLRREQVNRTKERQSEFEAPKARQEGKSTIVCGDERRRRVKKVGQRWFAGLSAEGAKKVSQRWFAGLSAEGALRR